MTKELSYVILKSHNVRMKPSNVRKKKKKGKETTKYEKKRSHVMLKLHNVRMKSSNVRKKVREPLNVRKELSHVILE